MNRKFRKLPVEIEAVQLTWANWPEVCVFVGNAFIDGKFIGGVFENNLYWWGEEAKPSEGAPIAAKIHTLEGDMIADENDWIIRGVNGELYPCKPDIFNKTYEPVDVSLVVDMLCPKCNQKLSKGAAIGGQDKYFCVQPECGDRFKAISAGDAATPEDRPNTTE